MATLALSGSRGRTPAFNVTTWMITLMRLVMVMMEKKVKWGHLRNWDCLQTARKEGKRPVGETILTNLLCHYWLTLSSLLPKDLYLALRRNKADFVENILCLFFSF